MNQTILPDLPPFPNSKEKLLENIKSMTILAGTSSSLPKFQALSSCIPTLDSATPISSVIVIDIGGTATKVGVRMHNQSLDWQILIEEPNDSFEDSTLPVNSLERFAAMVAKRITTQINKLREIDTHWALGIVWSNAMQNSLIKNIGIDGNIINRARYSKAEWFNQDTKDEDSIGQIFLKAFNKSGINISLYLVANDTPLTMKALKTANAGMVVSTGLNATVVKKSSSGPIICNAEMGTSFFLDKEFIHPEDFIAENKPASIIEHLVSGKNLPRLFASHIMANTHQYGEVCTLSKYFKSIGPNAYEFFTAQDLANCLERPHDFLTKTRSSLDFDLNALKYYQALCRSIIIRAARLSSLFAYAAVFEQFTEKNHFIIALDSSLSRGIPLFCQTFQESLNEITPKGKSIKLELIDRLEVPGGIISVPMQGAANALDALSAQFESV
ncbi:MAG: hypothetical protein SGJ02_10970 [bacterium]|nr:hypothetical protein [bacterium]